MGARDAQGAAVDADPHAQRLLYHMDVSVVLAERSVKNRWSSKWSSRESSVAGCEMVLLSLVRSIRGAKNPDQFDRRVAEDRSSFRAHF